MRQDMIMPFHPWIEHQSGLFPSIWLMYDEDLHCFSKHHTRPHPLLGLSAESATGLITQDNIHALFWAKQRIRQLYHAVDTTRGALEFSFCVGQLTFLSPHTNFILVFFFSSSSKHLRKYLFVLSNFSCPRPRPRPESWPAVLRCTAPA